MHIMEARRRAAKKKKLKKMGKSKSTDTEEEEQEEDVGDDGKIIFTSFFFLVSYSYSKSHAKLVLKQFWIFIVKTQPSFRCTFIISNCLSMLSSNISEILMENW